LRTHRPIWPFRPGRAFGAGVAVEGVEGDGCRGHRLTAHERRERACTSGRTDINFDEAGIGVEGTRAEVELSGEAAVKNREVVDRDRRTDQDASGRRVIKPEDQVGSVVERQAVLEHLALVGDFVGYLGGRGAGEQSEHSDNHEHDEAVH